MRRYVRTFALSVGLLALAACTGLVPIQKPGADRRFPLAASKAQTSFAPCVGREAADMGCEPLAENIDRYNAGLGRAIWEMDERRRQLVGQAADHTNLITAYNALLWPVGAYLLAHKIHRPSWSTVDAAALGVATYGLLSSGIPDRDKLYLRAASRMACALVEAEAELYDEPLRQSPETHGLRTLMRTLNSALDEHRRGRDELVTLLALRAPGQGSTGRTPVERTRLAALNRGGAAKAATDPSEALLATIDQLQAQAQGVANTGGDLLKLLDKSGVRLRERRGKIEDALTQALNDRTPELRNPLDTGRDIAKAFEQGMASERAFTSRLTQESGRKPAPPWWPTPANLKALTPGSADQVRSFWLHRHVILREHMLRVSDWQARHAAGVKDARAMAVDMGCDEGSLGSFTTDLLKRVSDAAAKSAGSASAPAAAVSPLEPKP